MNENKVYEITAEVEHLNSILKALSCYINVMYETIDNEIVSMKDVQKTFEDIKVCSDIQIVLKHTLGKTTHSPKQTSENTNLIWCKEVDLGDQVSSNDEEPFEPFNDEGLQDSQPSQPLRKSDEQRQKELNDSVEYAKYCLDTFLKNQQQPKESSGILSKAWDNVKEHHWDTIKRMGDK